jgi:hypothetical protein
MAKKQLVNSPAGASPKTAARRQRRQTSQSAAENRPATLAATEVGGHAMENAREAQSVAVPAAPEKIAQSERPGDPAAASTETGGVAAQRDPTAVATASLSKASVENDTAATTADEPAERAEVPSAPQPEYADEPTASPSGAGRPPASTKRAMLIGMLERAQGASVAELGQRLGWLPHTVRAAITGVRHAGREVTRSKDANGQSVYRLAPVEPADR